VPTAAIGKANAETLRVAAAKKAANFEINFIFSLE
jgi:hypothetical protein